MPFTYLAGESQRLVPKEISNGKVKAHLLHGLVFLQDCRGLLLFPGAS